jgi:hypothetical protein
MKRITSHLAAIAAAALCAANAWAANPDTESRAGALAGASGSTTVCENGTNNGTPCAFAGDCTGGGTCTAVANVQVKARGLLTIIADTKPFGIGWTSTTMPGCTNPIASTGTPGSCETPENATFTLMLEFTLNAKKYTYAETFVRLPNGNNCPVSGDCSGQIENWTVGGNPNSEAGWNQLAIESTISERSLFTGTVVKLRWGGLPPAAEAAVGAVIGKTASQRVAMSRTDSVPICTDTTPCNLSATNPHFSDHSNGTDPLATVRRWKVDIAVIGP